jgi:hypothetical protein
MDPTAGKILKAFSIRLLLALCLVPACTVSVFAVSVPIHISAAEIELDGFLLTGIEIHNEGDELRLDVSQVTLNEQPGLSLERFSLSCHSALDPEAGYCTQGEWQLGLSSKQEGWNEAVSGKISALAMSEAGWSMESSLLLGEFDATIDVAGFGDKRSADIRWNRQDINKRPFAPLWPDATNWLKAGQSSGHVHAQLEADSKDSPASGQPEKRSVRFEADFQGVSLDSPEGLYAAEGLALQAQGAWVAPEPGSAGDGQVNLQAGLLAGEVLIDQFYASFSARPLQLKAQVVLGDQDIYLNEIRLDDKGALNLHASANFALDNPLNSLQYQVRKLDLTFPAAYTQYLEPILARWTLDKLVVTGGLSWSGTGEASDFPSGSLLLEDLSVVDQARQRFAFTGMKAHIEAGYSQGLSDFSWQGLLLEKINLGAGSIALKTAPGIFALASPLTLEMLGGELGVEEFRLRLPPSGSLGLEPEVEFQAELRDLDMEQLSRALDWPLFEGKISGRIPGVSFDNGVLTVDGLLNFEAFDGQILLSDLRVERLFGVLPSFAANLEVINLDLQQLTHTFSFGQIAGRLDGYVRELRMLDWSPVSFDAWFGTPESQSRSRQISRQAVNHLTSIGGGGATAALTGPLMRMFNNFSYSKLGMGCKLENYVCTIRGLNDEIDSVLIMEGSGIPKLSIRVFNRRMDWPQLVSNLSAASSGESIRIGDP